MRRINELEGRRAELYGRKVELRKRILDLEQRLDASAILTELQQSHADLRAIEQQHEAVTHEMVGTKPPRPVPPAPARRTLHDLLDQIDAASDLHLYHAALMAALTIPDIAGGLSVPGGRGKGADYKAWFDDWVAADFDGTFTGRDCYGYRCSVLHQGSGSSDQGQYKHVAFLEPGGPLTLQSAVIGEWFVIDIPTFTLLITDAARRWLAEVEGTEPFETNWAASMKRYPDGIAPVV